MLLNWRAHHFGLVMLFNWRAENNAPRAFIIRRCIRRLYRIRKIVRGIQYSYDWMPIKLPQIEWRFDIDFAANYYLYTNLSVV